jgi:ATP-binding cassette, subfamily B, bacterial
MNASKARIPAARILGRLIAFRPLDYFVLVTQTLLFYAVELVPPLVLQAVLNALGARTPEALAAVWGLLGGMMALQTIKWVTVAGWAWAEGRLIRDLGTLLRRNMLAHVLDNPVQLPQTSGEAIARFRDDARDYLRFLTFLPDMPSQLLTLIAMIAIMAGINWKLTLAAAVPIVLSLLAAQLSSRTVKRLKRETQEAVGAVTGSLGEILGATLAIKLSANEDNVVRAFERVSEARRKSLLRITLVSELLQTFSWNTSAFATAAVLIAAVVTGEHTRMGAGDLALFIGYFSSMNFLIGFFGDILMRYRQADVVLRRMSDLLVGEPREQLAAAHEIYTSKDAPEAAAPKPVEPLRELRVEGLRYRFPGAERDAIADASFVLKRGELTVVTGRVGAGKTTLLRAVLGLVQAEGARLWNGARIEAPDRFFRPPASAYVPQTPRLFSDTLRENLTLGAPGRAEQLQAAIHNAVFERDVAEFERGLETLVGVRGAKVSGGQLQRSAAARAFVREPELIVVDDLSSALDVETESMLWERLLSQTGQRTVLAVSHRPPALERASHIILVKDGRVLDQGALHELLARCPEMREIYGEASPG